MEAIREEDAIKGPLGVFGLGLALSFNLATKGVFLGLLPFAPIMLSSSIAIRARRKRRRFTNIALNFLLRNHPTRDGVKWAVAQLSCSLLLSPWSSCPMHHGSRENG